MINKKIMKVSEATNKQFNEAEMRKMSQTDLASIEKFVIWVPEVLTVPIPIIISVVWLF